MNEEISQISGFADTSRSSSPSIFTDLQTVQIGDDDHFLRKGETSDGMFEASSNERSPLSLQYLYQPGGGVYILPFASSQSVIYQH